VWYDGGRTYRGNCLKRFARHLFTIAAGLGLLLSLAACALWTRGYFAQDEWRWTSARVEHDVFDKGDAYVARRGRFVTSGRGGVALGQRIYWEAVDPGAAPANSQAVGFDHDAYDAVYPIYPENQRPQEGVQYTLLGFQVRTERESGPNRVPLKRDGQFVTDPHGGFVWLTPRIPLDTRERMIVVPLWAVAVGCAVPPAVWASRYNRRRRIAARRRRGDCLHCGYPLTRGGGHDRWPECGTSTEAAMA
jgi:hypothetical protein